MPLVAVPFPRQFSPRLVIELAHSSKQIRPESNLLSRLARPPAVPFDVMARLRNGTHMMKRVDVASRPGVEEEKYEVGDDALTGCRASHL